MGLFKVIGGVVKGTATVVGGVAKGTAIVAEGLAKGTVAVAEGISDILADDDNQNKNNDNDKAKVNKDNNHSAITSSFVIEEGVTSIDSEDFESYDGETSIVLPSTLEDIDSDAFEECQQVEEIDFSKVSKVKTIPSGLFDELHSLKEITIPEGVVDIEKDAITNCVRLNKVVLPSTLKTIGCQFYGCEHLREIDTSKVCRLKEIPENMVECESRISNFVIPQGVEVVGDSFLDGKFIHEVHIPSSVKKIGSITDDDENHITAFLYSDRIDDIEDLGCNVKILYVKSNAYEHYKELMDDLDTEAELKRMPAFMADYYSKHYVATPKKQISPSADAAGIETVEKTVSSMPKTHNEGANAPKESATNESIKKSPGNLFSDGLEELINSVAESDELTDKKKEIVLRRAVKEGEDPDEVEMVLEARFYEAHNK